MTQCKRILDDGERCSNRATPGEEYCEAHRRIQFRRVAAPPELPAAPAAKPKKGQKAPPPPTWVAQPAALGAAPRFPGLRADARAILVAPEARLWLPAIWPPEANRPTPLFARVVQALGALSQHLSLAGQVALHGVPENAEAASAAGALLALSPAPETDLSRLYDAIADTAAWGGGRLYIGAGRAFIAYRDAAAPRGYDIESANAAALPPGALEYLVDESGTHPLDPAMFPETPLADFLLRITPLPERGASLPEQAYVLAAPQFYRLLVRYFRAHHIAYRVARFHTGEGRIHLLFEIAPQPAAPTGATLPAFLLAYLGALPRVAVLRESSDAGRRMLVAWDQRFPCAPAHSLSAFPEDSLVLITGDPELGNLCVAPAPAFFDGDALTTAHLPHPARAAAQPLHTADDLPLRVAVRLTPDAGPLPPTAALLLDAQEFAWLRRLLFHLPDEAFAGYRLCVGESGAVLLGEALPLEALPFGIPLRRFQDTALFLPLRARFTPALSWPLLAQALALQAGQYTFLTPEARLDLPQTAFAPLSQALVAEARRPRLAFTVRPPATLPELRWTAPPEPASATAPPEIVPKPGLLERLVGRPTSPVAAPEKSRPSSAETAPPGDPRSAWRAQATAHLEAGAYLEAALCFGLAGDAHQSAQCYRRFTRPQTEN